jgi:hypothetical protein
MRNRASGKMAVLTDCRASRLARPGTIFSEASMLTRTVATLALLLMCSHAMAQDVPGIEICTVDKTMERRTSCLQSNVIVLQKTISKLAIDNQQKLDAANRQIETLKAALAGLQKTVDDLQAAQKKDATAKTPPAPAPAPAAKDAAK